MPVSSLARGGPLLAILALSFLTAGAARAADPGDEEPPVAAVIPFAGQTPYQAMRLNVVCEQALRRIKGLKVITAVQWEREAKESGQGDDLEAMARRLDADVLVTGSLSRGQKGWRLAIDVFDDHAQPLQSFEVDLIIPEVGPAAAFRLEEALARVIRPATGLRESSGDPADSGPQPAEPAPQTADSEAVTVRAEIEGLRQRAPAQRRVIWPPWRPLFEGRVGLVAVGRTLSCGGESPQRLNLPCSDTLFPLDGGAGIRLDVALFPLARLRGLPRPLLGLGVGLLLDAPFWRDRQLANDGSSAAVRQIRVEGGLRWRWNIGDRVRRPILELGLAYGYHLFNLLNDSVPYPDFQYQYLLPSLGLGSYLTPRLPVRLGLGFPIVISAGDATEPTDVQNQNPFGSGRGFGFRLLAEGEYLVWRKLSLGLGASIERVVLSFDGSGCTKSAPRQGLCDDQIFRDVGFVPPPAVASTADIHLSLWLTLGYRY